MAITSPTNHNAMVQVDDLVDMCFLMYDEDGYVFSQLDDCMIV